MEQLERMERDIVVSNELGLHARPASMLVRTASGFQSNVELVKNDMTVDCKSVLGLMMLSAVKGTELKVVAYGAGDAAAAAAAVAQLFHDKFGEE